MSKKMNSLPSEQNKNSLLMRIYKNPYFRYLLFGVFLALFPVAASIGVIPNSFVTLMGSVLIYSVVGLGLNLLLGYSGLISLGTAGFMGLGAYLAGYLTTVVKAPFLLGLIAALFVAALIGVVVGFVSLRVAGIYLAIATLCVAEILRKTFEELDWLTNGFSGLQGSYPTFFGMKMGRSGTYLLTTVVLILIMMLTHNLVNGQLGRALHAMRGSEVAAQAMGINLLKYRLIIFAIASCYAALGGVLYVHFVRYSFPTTWVMMLSLQILGAVVIGGLRSIYGTVFGAFIIFAIPDMVLKPLFGNIDGLPYVFTGVLIILVVMFYPSGVKGLGNDLGRLWKFVRKKWTQRHARKLKKMLEEAEENG